MSPLSTADRPETGPLPITVPTRLVSLSPSTRRPRPTPYPRGGTESAGRHRAPHGDAPGGDDAEATTVTVPAVFRPSPSPSPSPSPAPRPAREPRPGAQAPPARTIISTPATRAAAAAAAPPVPSAPVAPPSPVPGAPGRPAPLRATRMASTTLAPSPQPSGAAALERQGRAPSHPLARRPLVRGALGRMATRVPVPYAVVRGDEDVPAQLSRLYAVAIKGREEEHEGRVHVVQLTPWYACDVGLELVRAGQIVGDDPWFRDLTPGVPYDPAEPRLESDAREGAAEPTLLSLRHPLLDPLALDILSDARTAVLIADARRSDPTSVAESAGLLAQRGVTVAGLVLVRGKIPRDPALAR